MLWLIRRQLKSGNAEVRRQTVLRLARSSDGHEFACLVSVLEDQDPGIRAVAAAALAKAEDPSFLDALLRCLKDSSADVLKAALSGLKQHSDSRTTPFLVPLLRHPDSAIREMAGSLLTRLGWTPTNPQDEMWHLAASSHYAKVAAFGSPAIPVLEAGISSAVHASRVAAVQALGTIKDPRALPLLLTALNGTDTGLSLAAIDTLQNRGDEDAAFGLIPALRNPNPRIRAAAVESLGRIRLQAAADPIRPLLEDPEWEVRKQAVEALGRIRDTHSVPELGTRLERDADGDVREAAAVALGSVGARQGIEQLVIALKDSEVSVRQLATAALSRIDPDWSLSPEALTAAAKLKNSLQDANPSTRQLVGQVLSSLGVGDPAPRPAPSSAPGDQDSTPDDSSAAKKRKLALSLLMTLLCDSDRDLRQAAAEALGDLPDERSRSALLRAKTDSDEQVRLAAETSLQKIPTETTL
jgi:HEAT repeat protein